MRLEQNDPRAYLKILWRWKFLFLAFVVGIPAVVYFAVSSQPKVYQSSVLLEEDALPVDTSLFTSSGAPAPSTSPGNETLGGQARVIETPAVARMAATHLHPAPADPRSLLGSISASGDQNTGFITVAAKASTPQRAADIANAFGAAVVTLRTQQALGLLTTAIDQLSAQLAHMSPNDIGRQQLSGELQRLRALRAAQGVNAQILEAAVPSTSAVSPRTSRAVSLGLLAGLILGLGAVFLAEAADRRVRHPEDLEELTGLPLLSVIPRGAFSGETTGRREVEAFHMLRSTLTFFNVDRQLSTILVASPVKGDGKTTVAARLAVAAAEAGKDVILVDADLRRPQASTRLGVTGDAVAPGHGLAAVLTDQISLADALVEVSVRPGDSEDETLRGRLRLLPAGGTPPNPSELLASQRMREVLDEVRTTADLVVIDTNPVLSVSDSLPLFELVSGVVLVAKLNSTTKDAVRRIQKTIANTSGTVLGVVATGAVGGLYGRYGYGYGYGYYGYTADAYANGNGHSKRVIGRFGSVRRSKQPE